jgi:hypothetical protein
MTTLQKFQIAATLSVVIAVALVGRKPPAAAPVTRFRSVAPVSALLGVVAISLLVVGVVSQTLLRHVVQITPLILALVVLGRWPAGVSAAVPLFVFWLLVMIGIWSFLLGIARIFTGTYTLPEIALTIVIAVASLAGLAATNRRGSTAPMTARIALIASFAFLQYAAMWISVQPFVRR